MSPDPLDDHPPAEDLESVFEEAPPTEERVYSYLVESTGLVTAPDVARDLSCSTDTARKYLNWFVELGVAIKHDGRPIQYERNTEYFEWRYVSELANSHSIDDLRANVVDIRERIETFRERYDADDPSSVTVTEAADRLGIDIEEAWDDLSTWAGLEDELRLHDRARQQLSDRTGVSAD